MHLERACPTDFDATKWAYVTRPDVLASAVESGVDAVMRRPLDASILTSCVGEVLRRHANVEHVYKVWSRLMRTICRSWNLRSMLVMFSVGDGRSEGVSVIVF